jgi:NAD-dependent SIR2 family protein deacetylase
MAPSSDIIEFRKVLESSKNIMVLSGAGLSAPSGTYGHVVILYSTQKSLLRDCDLSWNFGIHVVRSGKQLYSVFVLKLWFSLLGNS